MNLLWMFIGVRLELLCTEDRTAQIAVDGNKPRPANKHQRLAVYGIIGKLVLPNTKVYPVSEQ